MFDDDEVLKFTQANQFNIDKTTEKLILHFDWLHSLPPEPRLTSKTLRLLQSGAFYIFGRDKFYRPCIIVDGGVVGQIN